MAVPSFLNPIPTNPIIGDVNQIHALLNILARVDPSLGAEYPEKSIRIKEVQADTARRRAEIKRAREAGETPKTTFAIEIFRDGAWVSMGNFAGSASDLDGYKPSENAVPGTIPVYNANGELVGNITGNAATADKLKQPVKIDIGGIASATAQDFDGSNSIVIPINSINLNNAADTAVLGVLTPEHGGTGRTDGAVSNVVMDSPQGEVSASEYGILGPMKTYSKATTDADSLTIQGNYYISGDSTGWAANHWPDNRAELCKLSVYYVDQIIIQEYVSKAGGAWKRYSENGGASFTGWQPLGSTTDGHVGIYISKSGNDANTGLDSGYPVLTMGRAFEIARGLANAKNAGNIGINFYIGAGEWGDLWLYSAPHNLHFYPYDGGSPTSYSTELPVFNNINIANTYVSFKGIIGRFCSYGAFVLIQGAWNRIKSCLVQYGGAIAFDSKSELEVLGTDSYQQLCAYYCSLIVASNIKIKLVANATSSNGFIYVASGGVIVLDSSFTVDLNGFSNNGRKAYIGAGGNFIDSSGSRSDAGVNKLPGTGYFINVGGMINGLTWGQVLKTGDWMTGTLGIQKTWPHIDARNTGLEMGVAPSATQYGGINFTDKNGLYYGQLFNSCTTGKVTTAEFSVRSWKSSGQAKQAIGVQITESGTANGYAPTPASTSNSTDIATTAWVRTFHNNNLPSSGGSSTTPPTVDNTTITGSTLLNGVLNNCTVASTPAVTNNSNLVASTSFVHALLDATRGSMVPAGNATTVQNRAAAVWYTASTVNCYVAVIPVGGVGNIDIRPSSTGASNTLGMASVPCLVWPFKKNAQYRMGASGNTHTMNCINVSANTRMARDAGVRELQDQGKYVYIVKLQNGEVDACGDLIALATSLGLNLPDPDDLTRDYGDVMYWYNNMIEEEAKRYEQVVINIKTDFAIVKEDRIRTQEVRYINQLSKYRDRQNKITPDEEEKTGLENLIKNLEMAFENEKDFTIRGVDAEMGEMLVKAQTEHYKNLNDIKKQATEKEMEAYELFNKQVMDVYEERWRMLQEAEAKADLKITVQEWIENGCHAAIDENGNIVLGPTYDSLVENIEKESKSRLAEYDDAIVQLERQKRFGQLVSAKGKAAGFVARYAGRLEDIDSQILEWDLYAATITMMPEQEGFPWDGGGKDTPWPEKPAKVTV